MDTLSKSLGYVCGCWYAHSPRRAIAVVIGDRSPWHLACERLFTHVTDTAMRHATIARSHPPEHVVINHLR
jgi:hypothetical protein